MKVNALIEQVARAIAKAQTGTDVFWENYSRAAKAAIEAVARQADHMMHDSVNPTKL